MQVVIRGFKEEANIVSEIIHRNFLEVNIKDYSCEEMESKAQIFNSSKMLDINNYAHYYVACYNGDVVGCGSIASYWNKDNESFLSMIFVLPELQEKVLE